MSAGLPGDPSPSELARADRMHAAVRDVTNQLTGQPAGTRAGHSTEDWIRFAHGPLVDAVDDLAGGRHDVYLAASLGLAAEALLQVRHAAHGCPGGAA